jgi:hypothetical protein
VPARVRSDHGSENTQIAMVIHGDERAHIFGSSTANLRIESQWGRLIKLNKQIGIGLECCHQTFS